MKKILSLILACTMLLGCITVFAACDDSNNGDNNQQQLNNAITKELLEADPAKALGIALEQSLNSFFSDDLGTDAILAKAAEKGKYTLSFASNDLMGSALTKISETIYTDTTAGQIVSDAAFTYNGEELSALIFFNKNGLALSSEAIFGDNTTLLFNPTTFAENLKGSLLAEILELDSATCDEILAALEMTTSGENVEFAAMEEAFTTFFARLLPLIKPTVTTENENGKNYLVATYTVDNVMIKNLLTESFDFIKENKWLFGEELFTDGYTEGEFDTELDMTLDMFLNEFDNYCNIDLKAKAYVEADTSKLTKITFKGDINIVNEVTGEYEYSDAPMSMPINVDMTLSFSDLLIALEGKITVQGQVLKMNASIAKSQENGGVAYHLVASIGVGPATVEFLRGSFTRTQNGDFTLQITLLPDSPEEINASVKGNLTVTDKAVTLTINSISAAGQTITFDLKLSAEAVDSIPQMPANAKDIMSLTEKEWEELVIKMYESPLFALIAELEEN